ncbi:MAG TPA: hypothetical protein VFV41_01265 [Streptosporangiaceae bacterium]|nr:hypothetical protein [Streptosporangiaceae bacterium]
MRTTMDLPEDLLTAARALARAGGCTLAAVLAASLREAVTRHRTGQFVLRDASVAGNGLTAEFAGADGARIRAAGYGC